MQVGKQNLEVIFAFIDMITHPEFTPSQENIATSFHQLVE